MLSFSIPRLNALPVAVLLEFIKHLFVIKLQFVDVSRVAPLHELEIS